MLAGPLPDDDALPAAVHLAGPRAEPLLRAAIDFVGGRLHSSRPIHIQYRPGSDVVVRFDSLVSWRGADPVRETLMAATSRDGAPAGTVPVVAEADGRQLAVGVWRWPFDPFMPALAAMVTPREAAARLGELVHGPLELAVVAYRPTERAVVRVIDANGTVLYVKVLPPARVASLVERHRRLRAAGVPAPLIVAADEHEGWLAMAELAGDTVRERIKSDAPGWPDADAYLSLLRDLRSTGIADRRVATRTTDAVGHAAMLAAVAPDLQSRLDAQVDAIEPAIERADARRTAVHGDLHEAQLVVDGTRIVGLLDVDDAGCGDPLDDLATVLAHLRFRAAVDDRLRTRIGAYADELATAFSREAQALGCDAGELHIVTAAVLVGLATGPFRIQRPHWRRDVDRVLAAAEYEIRCACDPPDERSLSARSSGRHRSPRELTCSINHEHKDEHNDEEGVET